MSKYLLLIVLIVFKTHIGLAQMNTKAADCNVDGYEDIINFWLEDARDTPKNQTKWWVKDAAIDQEIKDKYECIFDGIIKGEIVRILRRCTFIEDAHKHFAIFRTKTQRVRRRQVHEA